MVWIFISDFCYTEVAGACSSAVELIAYNGVVAGSIPAKPTSVLSRIFLFSDLRYNIINGI